MAAPTTTENDAIAEADAITEADAIAEADAFPSLDPGVTLLETDGRALSALQPLVLDHVLLSGAGALWVDARNNAGTYGLFDLAPSPRVLDRIRVARAFTAFQHYSAVTDLVGEYRDTDALLVLPAVDWFYGDDDLRRGEGETMLRGALETVGQLADACDVPAVVTRHRASGVGAVVGEYADHELTCEQTDLGPRFSGDSFETLCYHGQGYVQTTLAYWRRVLAARHPTAYDAATPTDAEVVTVGSH